MNRMKVMFAPVLALVLFLMSGCNTTSQAPGASAGRRSAAAVLVGGFVSDAALIVLNRNPEAKPVIRAVRAGINSLLTGEELSQGLVDQYLEKIDNSQRLSPDEKVILRRGILRAYNWLAADIQQPVLTIKDERVKQVLDYISKELATLLNDADALASG